MDFLPKVADAMEILIPGLQYMVSILLFIIRILVPLLFILVVWRCFSSMQKGRRREDPVVMLEDTYSHAKIPVLYWENSIGREKTCDISLPDDTISRDHAVLMRRESGWIITDTGSKSGTYLNRHEISGDTEVLPGDVISVGSASLKLTRVSDADQKKQPRRRVRAASPAKLMWVTTLILFLLALQCCLRGGTVAYEPLIPFALLMVLGWGFYLFSRKALGRVSFELETLGLLLSGTGVMLLYGDDPSTAYTQLAAMFLGILLFCFLIWFMGDLDRVTAWRLPIGIAAILLFGLTLVVGSEINGAQNWIIIGPLSIQPSELIKIAFIFAGASTLNKLQTAKNLTEFIVFAAICIGFLFFMHDFGTAVIFFVTFLIIAFMRSGSIRTIVLVCSAAVIGLFLILQFKPYVADRFAGWGHIWEDPANTGYQQTRVLTYSASGGLFGMGLGNGYLKEVFAGNSDLVFGMLCEELGLLLALSIIACLALFVIYTLSDVTRSRSTFYSISSCAAAGMLLFQACVNVFGATDVLPLTGVTLPFISAGGSSMIGVWGLLAFIKASDERTYAARRRKSG